MLVTQNDSWIEWLIDITSNIFPKFKHIRAYIQFINQQLFFSPLAANYWFSASNHENGASKFILLSTFSSQYLVKDNCTVEAEVTILGMVDALSWDCSDFMYIYYWNAVSDNESLGGDPGLSNNQL